jgi:hypothetical protein
MTYLIECPNCEATMESEIKGQINLEGDEEFPFTQRVSLCECPKCHSAIVGLEESDSPFDEDFDTPTRVWPSPPVRLNIKIPKPIRESLIEAEKCLRGKAYTACIAMCGRALEAIGRHFFPAKSENSRPLMLKQAIDKLASAKIIDGRLHKWGLALHRDRNLASHPSGTDFKMQDARDVFKFASNICEYIFVLSAEFEDYEKRRKPKIDPKSI